MNLGQLSETVVVAGTAALVETRSATMSGLVDDRRVQELPLNGRNVVELASTLPGITDVAGVGRDGQHARRADDDRARRLSRSEQLHAERSELHQLLADRRIQSAAARRGAGNPRADVDVLGRVRQQRRRAGDDGHQGRQQSVPWVGVGVPSQRRAERAELLRAAKVGAGAEPVGRGGRRPHRAEQAVLLRFLSEADEPRRGGRPVRRPCRPTPSVWEISPKPRDAVEKPGRRSDGPAVHECVRGSVRYAVNVINPNCISPVAKNYLESVHPAVGHGNRRQTHPVAARRVSTS